jgi:16S rRNA (cytidine1402-2'-O)-methyltransferase
MATVHIVSTPIGNLGDLSPRGAATLASADRILAEDTRRTATLLRHLGAKVPMVSVHAHNEARRVRQVLEWLAAGERLVLVSDAGTPLVSDPGARLVRAVIDEGHEVVPVPGPSAVLVALVGAGLPGERFSFLGFVPRKGRARTSTLQRIAESEETTVSFESPDRLTALLRALVEACGPDRPACVARELTKMYETFQRGTLAELHAYYQSEEPRGEITLVVGPAPESSPAGLDDAARAEAARLLAEGAPPSRVAREVARVTGLARNRAYALVQSIQAHDEGEPIE